MRMKIYEGIGGNTQLEGTGKEDESSTGSFSIVDVQWRWQCLLYGNGYIWGNIPGSTPYKKGIWIFHQNDHSKLVCQVKQYGINFLFSASSFHVPLMA